MISTALGMLLAGLTVTAFYHFRKSVNRSEDRLAMCSSAQNIYVYMQRILASAQHSCAFVVTRIQRSAGITPDPGEIRIVFMRGKEEVSSFRTMENTSRENEYIRNDLTWELWVWKRSDQTFSIGTNSIGGTAQGGRSFVSGDFSPAGVNYNNQRFFVTPQPRRTLNATDPFTANPGGLDDNILFPGAGGLSMANPTQDVGDYTDLKNNLTTVLSDVSDMSFDILTFDGTTYVIDDQSSAPPVVLNGVWLDGRLAPTLTAAPIYSTSDLTKRPRILRLRFTLNHPKWKHSSAPLASTFSFSFAMPGLLADH